MQLGLRGRLRIALISLSLLFIGILNLACASAAAEIVPAPTATTPALASETPTASPTATSFTATPTATDTDTPTPVPSPTETAAPTATASPSATGTQVPSPAPTIPPLERVPILMYHHVAIAPPDADAIRRDLSVPPDVFEAEMKYLSEQGFHSIHLAELADHFRNGTPLPPRPVVLTFDDGYDDNYVNAFPMLKDFGLNGTFFIIADRPENNAAGYMTWPQIEELGTNGMEIGAHSLDHKFDLGRLSYSGQYLEIKASYDAVARHLPNQAPVFAYPSGSYNATTLSILREVGIVAAVTTRQSVWQIASAPLELRRIRIRGAWSLADFVFWLSYWGAVP